MPDLGSFVHLHVHSYYSTLDGACHLDSLVNHVQQGGMGAVALTDHGNLFGALAFQKACNAGGIKPIIGAELYMSPTRHDDRQSHQARHQHHIVLLAETLEGYRNLSRLSSKAYLEGFYYKPRIDMELLAEHSDGLIGSSACLQGGIAQALLKGNPEGARRLAGQLREILGADNFYLELMDHGIPDEKRVNEGLLELSQRDGYPVIATNDCHYPSEAAHDDHDLLLCIQTGKMLNDPNRMRFPQNAFYLKTPEEMVQLFGHIDGAISNTVAIAERCNVDIPTGQKLLPAYRPSDGSAPDQYLRKLVAHGLRARYGDPLPEGVAERAEHELKIIASMGFVDYFLVVWDFIRWARDHHIPVGPGRGSGAGSIVAYALTITNLDPLTHGLLFERFLNPERVSMPDFDVDFCYERRGEVIEYVREKYGEGCVAQIITFGTIKARNAIRDAGRVLGVDLQKVDQVAKLVPMGQDVNLAAVIGDLDESKLDEKKLEEQRKLFSAELKEQYDNDPEVKQLMDRARGIEGAIRQPGTHAAGVVICDKPLIDLIPLYKPSEAGAMPATQYTMTEVEELGLLKMDFLGLKNLTIIDRSLKSIERRTGKTIHPDQIPLDDEETYKLLQQGRGLGLFQLESAGMRDLLVKLKPTRFSDIVALISLYRPGPMQNIPSFIARKEGLEPIAYDHPDMEPILKETYGLFVYQEQVMQVAQKLAGYSLGEADLLRRAMSKKKPEAMAKQKTLFVKGCATRRIDEATAERIWQTMETFAEYGFNKSHAAGYAVLAVQTAWLKRHYPVDFFAALISNEIGGDDNKILQYFAEARELGIPILPPDINTSSLRFEADDERIVFGLLAIKGIGEGAIRALITEREAGGPYKGLQNFVTRSDKRQINARALESLIRVGSFDRFGHNRPSLLATLPRIMELAGIARKDEGDPQTSLFDMMDEDEVAGLHAEVPIERLPDWPDKEKFEKEKELAGFYLSGHPLEHFEPDFEAFSSIDASDINEVPDRETIQWVGIINRLVPRTDKNGRMFAFAECEDRTGTLELTFFADAFDAAREFLQSGEVIWVRGRVDTWRDFKKVRVEEARPIDQVRREMIRALEVELDWRRLSEANLTRIKELAAAHKGRRRLWFHLREGQGEIRVEAGNGLGVQPGSELIRAFQEEACVNGVRFHARSGNGRG